VSRKFQTVLDMAGNAISNVATPTAATDGATKGYADLKLSLTGGTVTGGLTVNGTLNVGVSAYIQGSVEVGQAGGGTYFQSYGDAIFSKAVTLNQAPTQTYHAVTKAYADAAAVHDALTTAHAALRGTIAGTAIGTDTTSVGTSTLFARQDHKHPALVGNPVALGAAIAGGSSTNLARADHVHPYPSAANVGAVAKAGDTMTGPLSSTFLLSTGGVAVERPTGSSANLEFRTGSLLRWTMGKGPGAETGSNAGAEFNIAAWDDAGNWLSNPVSISRWDGKVTLANSVTVQGDVIAEWVEGQYGGWFSGAVSCDVVPTTGDHLTNKTYVDTKWTMWTGTQAAYDAIGTKDPNTLYAVIG
jgi:hypothetical protein